MKVALVASSFLPEPGRLERRVDQLARGLAARGAQVEVLTQGAHRRIELHEGVIVRRFPTGVGPLRFGAAPKLWDQFRPASATFDIVDVHTRHPSLALAVARAPIRRLVLTPSASIDVLLSWPYTRAMRALLASASHIVCRSEMERDLLCRTAPQVARRTRVVPDGVDVAGFCAAEPFAVAGIVVLSVDRLDRTTGVGRAIAAMPSLDPEFRLVVVGDGPARARLSAFAADLRISSRVDFVGAVSDAVLGRWFRTARVVVTLPTERSSGALLTEARAMGVSVVASDLPIHRQAAERPGRGHVILVPPRGSPLDVADAIDEAARLPVVSDLDLPVASAPSWESVVDSTWDLYQGVVTGAVESEADHAASDVVDLTARLQAGGESLPDGVMPATAQSAAHAASAEWWQTRLRSERGMNGARPWP